MGPTPTAPRGAPHPAGPDGEPLSDTDRLLLAALVEGRTVTWLAARLACSERTVYRRLRALYRRLGARHRAEALVRAARWRCRMSCASSRWGCPACGTG